MDAIRRCLLNGRWTRLLLLAALALVPTVVCARAITVAANKEAVFRGPDGPWPAGFTSNSLIQINDDGSRVAVADLALTAATNALISSSETVATAPVSTSTETAGYTGVTGADRLTVRDAVVTVYGDGSREVVPGRVRYHIMGSGLTAAPVAGSDRAGLANAPVTYEISPNAAVQGSVAFKQGNQTLLSASLAGLGYRDSVTGIKAIFSQVKSSAKQAYSDIVAYEDAFDGVDADALYRVQAWGIEQDVVVYGSLPDPLAYGIEPQNALLGVWTELYGLNPANLRAERSDGSSDAFRASPATLKVFVPDGTGWKRVLNLQRGWAWKDGGDLHVGGADRSGGQRVLTHLEVVGSRVFLVEEVSLSSLAGKTAKFQTPALAKTRTVPDRLPVALSATQPRPTPAVQPERAMTWAPRSHPNLVIDYINYGSTTTNDVTFQSGQTYFISSDLILAGQAKLIVQPNAIVKLANGVSIKLTEGARVISMSNLREPAIFTCAHDTSVGESIPGYTGSPAANRYGSAIYSQGCDVDLRGMNFTYGTNAVYVDSTASSSQKVVLRDVRIQQMITGVKTLQPSGMLAGTNVLFAGVSNALVNEGSITARLYVCTLANSTGMLFTATASGSGIDLHESILVRCTNGASAVATGNCTFASLGVYAASTNHTALAAAVLVTEASEPFDAGSGYQLVQTSTFVNSGVVYAVDRAMKRYTTALSGTEEGASLLDLGFHNAPATDTDGDGLYDFEEDADGDGVYSAADPSDLNDSDTDDDALSDSVEYRVWRTDPRLFDTDGDGAGDGFEVSSGTDPLNASSHMESIEGTVTYSGSQTGLIRVVAMREYPAALQYSFDTDGGSTVTDLSGNGYHGRVSNATWIANGYRGGAYWLNGTSSFINATDVLDLTGSVTQLTASVWVKAQSLAADAVYISKLQCASPYTGWALRGSPQNAFVDAIATYPQRAWYDSGYAVGDNVWHHLCGVFEKGANRLTVKLYVDGVYKGSNTYSGSLSSTDTSAHLNIGARDNNRDGNSCTIGAYDEVRIFARELVPTEVSNLYNYGASILAGCVTQSVAGAYSITNLLPGSYYALSAYLDANGNGRLDGSEPRGYYVGNSFLLGSSTNGIGVTLVDPDTDGDGFADVLETSSGTDPANSNSFPVTISGNFTYSGLQTGTYKVVLAKESDLLLRYDLDAPTWPVANLAGTQYFGTVSGATYTNLGHTGGAYSFDGVNDYILAGNMGSVTNGAISYWIYPASVENYRNPFTTDYASGDDCIRFEAYNTSNFVAGGLGMTGSMTMTTSMLPSNWYHVAFVWDKTNAWAYLNGRFVCHSKHSGTYPPGLNLNLANVALGNGYATTTNRYWKGLIDEARVYRRTLSATDVTNIYRGSVSTSLVGIATNVFASPGGFCFSNIPNQRAYTLIVYLDSDGDSVVDWTEAQFTTGLVANASTNYLISLADNDTDGDGLSDAWEVQNGFNPTSDVVSARKAWWKFDDGSGTNATNSVVGGYSGNLMNMSASAWTNGILGGALQFDGLNDYVRVMQSPAIITGGDVTVSAWVNLDTSAPDSWPTIVSDLVLCDGGFKGYWMATPGNSAWGWFGTCADQASLTSDGPSMGGRWVHACMTYTGGVGRLYIDGTQVVTASGPFEAAMLAEMTIGWCADTWDTYHWKGLIDDVRIYGTALTSNQVHSLFSDTAGDSDGDTLSNVREYQLGTNPHSADTDGDGLPDQWEALYGLDPTVTSNAWGDSDGDGWSDFEEFLAGTNPSNSASHPSVGWAGRLDVFTPLE